MEQSLLERNLHFLSLPGIILPMMKQPSSRHQQPGPCPMPPHYPQIHVNGQFP